MRRRGVFISLEGPEGGGKSTHARRLAERLRAAGHAVLLTREPGGTPLGEDLRRLLQHGGALCPEAELLLFLASRAQLVREVIRPALARGVHVICDRFADSTTAYQGYGRGLPLGPLLAMNRQAVAGLMPDLTLVLDIGVRAGQARLRGRRRQGGARRDRIERESRAFHERVRAGFLELARRSPRRLKVIPSGRPRRAVETAIWTQVQHVL